MVLIMDVVTTDRLKKVEDLLRYILATQVSVA
jgi:hypothetical protein